MKLAFFQDGEGEISPKTCFFCCFFSHLDVSGQEGRAVGGSAGVGAQDHAASCVLAPRAVPVAFGGTGGQDMAHRNLAAPCHEDAQLLLSPRSSASGSCAAHPTLGVRVEKTSWKSSEGRGHLHGAEAPQVLRLQVWRCQPKLTCGMDLLHGYLTSRSLKLLFPGCNRKKQSCWGCADQAGQERQR